MNKLTKIECDRQKVPGLYSDGKGLYLQVRPGKEGIRKSWVFRYTLPGKSPRTMGLGSFPDIGLADAREKALACRKLLADGIDPKDHRDQARAADAINSITFKDATIRYIETFGPRWKKGAAENLMREQEKHVFPVLADMRLTDITTQHVLQAVRPKWDIIPNQMWECLGAIRRILEFARAHGWTDPTKLNPAEWRGHIQHMLPAKDYSAKQHRPALPWQQVPEFIRRYREAAEAPGQGHRSMRLITADMIEFQILTAVRPSEAREARWNEIDLEQAVWTIPAERMKLKRPHRVPLSSRAMEILRRRFQPGAVYVFRQEQVKKWGDRPPSAHTALRTLHSLGLTDAMGIAISRHGFRSSFSTWARDMTNYSREVIEMSLAHEVKTGVEAAYFRGDHLEHRRPLMEDWAKLCTGQWTPAEIIPLRRRSG